MAISVARRTWWQLLAILLLLGATRGSSTPGDDGGDDASLSGCLGRDEPLRCAARSALARLRAAALPPGGLRVVDGVSLRRTGTRTHGPRGLPDDGLAGDVARFVGDHVLSVDLKRLARSLKDTVVPTQEVAGKLLGGLKTAAAAGKSTFLAGFGLGFLTFALKKLLLPFFIGAQIVKSVLIAMFLPSILGGLGKIVGKGVSTFASSSGSSGPSGGHDAGDGNVDDFDFKDNAGLDQEASMSETSFKYPEPAFSGVTYAGAPGGGLPPGTLPASSLYTPGASKSPPMTASNKVSYLRPANTHYYGSHYTRYSAPKHDYKVFHNIPSSSMLLTNYDPFYSPLLSRLDSVYKQLGYDSEECRERLVCSMYSNPAKFAPYSNLVSAQLSRELNELRKPSSDNPEILRFFRYMKAAKDGQDGRDCFKLHPSCGVPMAASTSPPLVKTFNDINKLVQARKMAAR